MPEGSDLLERLPEVARAQVSVTRSEAWSFDAESARQTLLDQLKTHGLEGFGVEGRAVAVRAAGGLVHYLRDTQKVDLAHVRSVRFKGAADCLIIDPITLQHLEVVKGSEGGPPAHSCMRSIARSRRWAAGCCARWLLRPLLALEPVRDCLDGVEELASAPSSAAASASV